MAGYTTENDFVIAEGAEGELYIYISAKPASPENPQIIYDGCDHAVFMRTPEEKIILDYINPQVRDKLRKALAVVVVETILENIKDCYIVNMHMVDKIPLDWNKIGLQSWEEASLRNQTV